MIPDLINGDRLAMQRLRWNKVAVMRPEVRGAAIATAVVALLAVLLVALGHWRAEPVQDGKRLSEWLNDFQSTPNPETRCRAARALGKMGPEALPAVPALVAALDARKAPDTVLSEVAEALRAIGKPAVPALAEAVKDRGRDRSIRQRAAHVLYLLGPSAADATPALRDALEDPEAEVRWEAAYALVKIGQDLDETLPAVLHAVKDQLLDNPYASFFANDIERLGSISVPGLRTVRDGADALARVEAEALLYRIDGDPAPALNVLKPALNDPSPQVRARAARRLGEMGSAAAKTAPDIGKALRDPFPEVRKQVGTALYRVKVPLPDLLAALDQSDILNPVCDGLIAVGPDAIAPLIQVVADAKASLLTRANAASALARFGTRATAAAPALADAVKQPSAPLRERAAGALRQIGPAAVPALADLLRDKEEDVRRLAAQALLAIPPQGVTFVWKALESEEAAVQASAVEALARQGWTLGPQLIEHLKDPSPQVKELTAVIISRLRHRPTTRRRVWASERVAEVTTAHDRPARASSRSAAPGMAFKPCVRAAPAACTQWAASAVARSG